MTYDDYEDVVNALNVYRNRGHISNDRYDELIKAAATAVGLHSDLSQMAKRYKL